MEKIVCKSCGTINQYTAVQAGPHLKAVCLNCNKYIKFLKQAGNENKIATDYIMATEKQLVLIKRLVKNKNIKKYDSEIAQKISIKRASEIIDELKRM